jgi:hypothetical protein
MAAFVDHDSYVAFVTDPSFYTDHHRLATELASHMGGEELDKEHSWFYPPDADLETIEEAIWNLSIGLGFYLGWCGGDYYKRTQPHISYKQLRPWVIINDIFRQMDIMATSAGINENHKWHYQNAKMISVAIMRCIQTCIPEELQDTVTVNKEYLDQWCCAVGYSFTLGDEEEES